MVVAQDHAFQKFHKICEAPLRRSEAPIFGPGPTTGPRIAE
jgi:hypothetical protein